MRRRSPHLINLLSEERTFLESLVRDGHTEQRVARRARILLAMADPETVIEQLAQRLEVERTTIWHLCRRFDALGVPAVFDAPRRGRPWVISPPGAGVD